MNSLESMVWVATGFLPTIVALEASWRLSAKKAGTEEVAKARSA